MFNEYSAFLTETNLCRIVVFVAIVVLLLPMRFFLVREYIWFDELSKALKSALNHICILICEIQLAHIYVFRAAQMAD